MDLVMSTLQFDFVTLNNWFLDVFCESVQAMGKGFVSYGCNGIIYCYDNTMSKILFGKFVICSCNK